MGDPYPLALVLWQLGEELREVQRLARDSARSPIVAVTGAKATLAVAIQDEGQGKLSFKVVGIGVEGGGGRSKETTTTLEVDLQVLTGPGPKSRQIDDEHPDNRSLDGGENEDEDDGEDGGGGGGRRIDRGRPRKSYGIVYAKPERPPISR